MNKSIKIFSSLCAVYFLATGLVLAEAAGVSIIDGLCGVLDENGVGFRHADTEGLQISANSANGNITVTCSLDQERPSTKRSVIFNYDLLEEECTVGRDSEGMPIKTKDWHQVISASGKTKLSCHYKQ